MTSCAENWTNPHWPISKRYKFGLTLTSCAENWTNPHLLTTRWRRQHDTVYRMFFKCFEIAKIQKVNQSKWYIMDSGYGTVSFYYCFSVSNVEACRWYCLTARTSLLAIQTGLVHFCLQPGEFTCNKK